MDALGSATVALAWLLAVFVPLEWAAPAWREQRRLRPGTATDLAFFAGQHLLFGGLVVWVFTVVLGWLPAADPDGALAVVRSGFARQPIWLRAIAVVILGDLSMYWGHRLQHRSALLWRFHSIHHTSEHLDFLAAHREHPIDGLYTQAFMNAPALLLGLSLEGMLGLIVFRGLWATFIHSNVRVPLGPLAYVFGSPQFHHLHHVRDRDVGNYANLAPWIDCLFGTHCSEAEVTGASDSDALDLGLNRPAPKTYLGLLAFPFRRWSK